jgi:hypothetical protein
MSNGKEGATKQEICAAPNQNRVMVCVDLVGPFTIRIETKTHSMLALTMIDPATSWFEIIEATKKSAISIQGLFHNTLVESYL